MQALPHTKTTIASSDLLVRHMKTQVSLVLSVFLLFICGAGLLASSDVETLTLPIPDTEAVEVFYFPPPQAQKPIRLNVQMQKVTRLLFKFRQKASFNSVNTLNTAEALNTTELLGKKQASPFAARGKTQVASYKEINNFLSLKHDRYSVVENKIFIGNTKKRLPQYKKLFQDAARQHQLDWRLVAAIAYQESVWDPTAVSPTGVRGMMMLTRVTAEEMGVNDRHDAKESVFGGTAYFKKIYSRLPASITGPDRTLMALAAYNAGYGHLIAARQLTAEQNGDPTKWREVKLRLPLLQQSKYYQHSKYGYARGARQAVHYVGEVQKHFDMLLMLTEKDAIKSGNYSATSLQGFAIARYKAAH